ncbi:MAG: Cof-type HAD-IIB family hydrolase [Lachnospirales bacterium]
MYKLIALDIDGTLLNSKREISKKTKEYMKKAYEKGVKFVLISGRSTATMIEIAKETGIDKMGGYIIGCNGGVCLNLVNNEIIYEKSIPNKYLKDIYEFAEKKDVPMLVYKDEEFYLTRNKENYILLTERFPYKKNIIETKDFLDEVKFDFNKALLVDSPEKILECEKEALKEFPNYELTRSEPIFLEFSPNGVHKAIGISKIMEIMNIKIDEVIAVGDSYNDLTMIEFAGLGVAMGNAHKEVKEIADYVTLSNDEEGISHIIEKFIL